MLSTANDDWLYEWMVPSKLRGIMIKHGVIEFYNDNDDYIPFKRIEFWDAWVADISESMSSTDNMPMTLCMRISPATVRYNKLLVIQKDWWQTDINEAESKTEEESEPIVQKISWRGRNENYISYVERNDIMLNHSIDLDVEFSEFTKGDSVELLVKQSNNRRIKGQAKEFTVNGTVGEDGTMVISNFRIECDFKEDNQDFGNIEFYHNDKQVGTLKENFGWTYIKENGVTKFFVNLEFKVKSKQSNYTDNDIKNAISGCFERIFNNLKVKTYSIKLFFSGTFTRELPQIVPMIQLDFGKQTPDALFNEGGNSKGLLAINTEANDPNYLRSTSETVAHELLHTIRLDHPHELTQAEDTKLYHDGFNNYSTALSTDPNIYYNIMNYNSTIIENQHLDKLWQAQRPEYLTMGQIELMIKEIDLHRQGAGTSTDEKENEDFTKMEWYWLSGGVNYPGEPVVSRYRKKTH